jgi:hypothetical protein
MSIQYNSHFKCITVLMLHCKLTHFHVLIILIIRKRLNNGGTIRFKMSIINIIKNDSFELTIRCQNPEHPNLSPQFVYCLIWAAAMPGAETTRLKRVPFVITVAGLLVIVSPRSRWQNGTDHISERCILTDACTGHCVLAREITDLFRLDPKFSMTATTNT